MTDRNFDPTAWFETYRETFAPMQKMHQESLKAIERLARLQYAFAGDLLENSLSQFQAAAAARNPAELMSRQLELGTRFGEKIQGRVQEFVSLAQEAQTNLSQAATQATSEAVKATPQRKAA